MYKVADHNKDMLFNLEYTAKLDQTAGGMWGIAEQLKDFKKKQNKFIYLASPYSHADKLVQERRYETVCRAYDELMEDYKDGNVVIFCPIAMSHGVAKHGNSGSSWTEWEKIDKAFIDMCDEIWVVPIKGYNESRGVRAEVDYARKFNKPVVFLHTLKTLKNQADKEVNLSSSTEKFLNPHTSKKSKLPYHMVAAEWVEALAQVAQQSVEKGYEPFNWRRKDSACKLDSYLYAAADRHCKAWHKGKSWNTEYTQSGEKCSTVTHRAVQAAYNLLMLYTLECVDNRVDLDDRYKSE